MRSVSYTDVLQIIVALIVLGYITQILLQTFGGNFIASIPEEKLGFFSDKDFFFKVKYAVGWGIFPTYILTPPIVQRMLITQDKRSIRRIWYVSALLYGLILLFLTLIGLGALAGAERLGIQGNDADSLLFRLVLFFLPKGSIWIDLIFVGFLGVLLSTIDSYLHAIGISFVQDLLLPTVFCGKTIGEQQKKIYAKIGIVLVGILATVISMSGNNALLNNMVTEMTGLALITIILIPLVFGVMGVKTEKSSFIGFIIAYMVTMGGCWAKNFM